MATCSVAAWRGCTARRAAAVLALTLAGFTSAAAPDTIGPVETRVTSDGVHYAVLPCKAAGPAPTLFVFAHRDAETLAAPAYNQVGALLHGAGVLCVSVDLPCHGRQQATDEPRELAGWRHRVDRGVDLIGDFAGRASKVLDHLIAEKLADPQRIAAVGTSRGGFAALSFAAAEPRVRAVAAFAPVTDLAKLREFDGCKQAEALGRLSLVSHAAKLADRALWITIGNHDERVSTDSAIEFSRAVVAAAVARKTKSLAELHISAAEGHRTHATAHREAAEFLAPILTGKPLPAPATR